MKQFIVVSFPELEGCVEGDRIANMVVYCGRFHEELRR